jgi:small subunit ribosomal protein S11
MAEEKEKQEEAQVADAAVAAVPEKQATAPAEEAEKQETAAADSASGQPTAKDILSEGSAPAAVQQKRSRHGRHVPVGVAHIKATFNNTLVSITDPRGAVISWSSAGRAGFKGSRKSTAFAATLVAQEAARAAVTKGMHEVEVEVQGAGAGRESAIRGIQSAGMAISVIRDVTPIAHNGCRARKRRRV